MDLSQFCINSQRHTRSSVLAPTIVAYHLNIMSDATETVKFNVGWRHFEVSRAIDNHLDTVLGKLVSDTWQDDPDKAVFVDRDGDIFAQILNYLRYGR
jgi:hypothetical protein